MENIPRVTFAPELHKRYLSKCLEEVPSSFSFLDTIRLIGAFFALSGLDVLNKLDTLSETRKKSIIEWIYSLQVINDEELTSGFQGSVTLNTKTNRNLNAPYKWGHIASTYAALAILIMLGDDLSRVNRKAIIKSLRALQLPDGSYKGAIDGAENDMRFVFCASCICYMLNDWTGIDMDKSVDFILKSISYDGGIGQGPQLEAHSGSTFCAIASLALSNQLHRLTPEQIKSIERWLMNRLHLGFNGRPNKPADTCYSFWTGGALKILNSYQYIDVDSNKDFVLMTQDKYGGLAKYPNIVPDPMHTYFGLAGLSLMQVEGLNPMYCKLNMTERAHEHLKSIHKEWSKIE